MADLVPLDTLAVHANSYASANGIQVERRKTTPPTADGKPSTQSSYFECAPMSLLPNAYPKGALAQAQDVAPSFNELVDRVSQDAEFLQSTLGGGVSDMDPFTANILKLYKEVYFRNTEDLSGASKILDSPAARADRLGIQRSDYMLHQSTSGQPYQLKQVELNTIAASFAGLSSNVFSLHRYLTTRFGPQVQEFLDVNRKVVTTATSNQTTADEPAPGVPQNPTLQRLPKAISVAFNRYVERHSSENTIVLFVVQEGETNTVDQRLLEFRLFEDYNIPVVRMSLTKAASGVAVDAATGKLTLVETGEEVAVIYYRAGYAPTDYPDGDDGIEWQARKVLETSRAAKCPSLGYHLAGTKKVQQELARPGVLEHFFPAPEEKAKVEAMRSCFAGLYSLGDDATEEDLSAVQQVLDGKQANYVLKPQREGGGYNFYGDQLLEKLKSLTSQEGGKLKLGGELAEYILMERLFPPEQKAILLRGGRVEGTGDSVSELGCYGTLLVDADGCVVHNEYGGFLLRTKFSNVDEGGVASGFATLSSPYLC